MSGGEAMNRAQALEFLRERKPLYWANENKLPFAQRGRQQLAAAHIAEASAALQRYAPLVERLFPETAPSGGIIESPLREIPAAKELLRTEGKIPNGRLFIKLDSHLPVAGSVKARGGIYEVLHHTERLALSAGNISTGDSLAALADHRDFFSQYSIQVGSTGNLGMSIGIAAAALGYRAVVHMSADAKEWKKALLRSKGVEVMEYTGDYSQAVSQGRSLSAADPKSHFVDDENSADLFLGYSVAGERLAAQLDKAGIAVDADHPLCVYLPCGVGGAPGGIAFGLKHIFGDNVHCFFVEPTECPCATLGLVTGKQSGISVQDIGLSGITEADGLAVGRPSELVCRLMQPLLDGCFTAPDSVLLPALRLLHRSEGIFIEPSSCIAVDAYRRTPISDDNATHILWATGGSLVPQDIRQQYLCSK
ncbi:MAG: D-serine ammonia-lyase [Ruminococcaceae bacterium]|nr:D-serine ammonia-lyase [Oscillospiraceae bacterium]